MEEQVRHRIGITGHRKVVGEGLAYAQAKSFLLKERERLEGNLEVNTGMALGFDQLLCEVCLSLGIPYVAVLPCEKQDAIWKEPQKKRYYRLLEKAERVVLVTPGEYEPWKMMARNQWIIENSDEVLTYWDGFYKGGTGHAIKLANGRRLKITNLFGSTSKSQPPTSESL